MIRQAERQDTVQQRKKTQIVTLMRELIEQVEAGGWYGEFSISFTAQNGQIGHYEEQVRKTYK